MLQLLDHLTPLGPFKKVFAGATMGAVLTWNDYLIVFGNLYNTMYCLSVIL